MLHLESEDPRPLLRDPLPAPLADGALGDGFLSFLYIVRELHLERVDFLLFILTGFLVVWLQNYTFLIQDIFFN